MSVALLVSVAIAFPAGVLVGAVCAVALADREVTRLKRRNEELLQLVDRFQAAMHDRSLLPVLRKGYRSKPSEPEKR